MTMDITYRGKTTTRKIDASPEEEACLRTFHREDVTYYIPIRDLLKLCGWTTAKLVDNDGVTVLMTWQLTRSAKDARRKSRKKHAM